MLLNVFWEVKPNWYYMLSNWLPILTLKNNVYLINDYDRILCLKGQNFSYLYIDKLKRRQNLIVCEGLTKTQNVSDNIAYINHNKFH